MKLFNLITILIIAINQTLSLISFTEKARREERENISYAMEKYISDWRIGTQQLLVEKLNIIPKQRMFIEK